MSARCNSLQAYADVKRQQQQSFGLAEVQSLSMLWRSMHHELSSGHSLLRPLPLFELQLQPSCLPAWCAVQCKAHADSRAGLIVWDESLSASQSRASSKEAKVTPLPLLSWQPSV